jgi:putative tricarboxylic transport membrane protein
MVHDLMVGFLSVTNLGAIFAIISGVSVGVILGAIPGLTATMGIALIIPITFYMDPVISISMLIGAYKGGLYGGSISAILLGTPGTDAAAATIIDGYKMAKMGKSGKALRVALFSSVIGDLTSLCALVFLAPIIAKFTLKIGPGEYFTLILFSLTIIAGVSGEYVSKGLIAAFFGFFLATIGMDPIMGSRRLTFGILELDSGIAIMPMLIGLFAVPEIIIQLEQPLSANIPVLMISKKIKDSIVSISEFLKCLKAIFIGSGIGILIGAIPGIGSSVSSWLAYKTVRENSKNANEFGTGIIEGIAAPEAGNNAVCGGALIPMLTLGVPGSIPVAILMSAFIIQGIVPGPLIFKEHGPLVYGIFASLFFSNIVLLLIGLLAIKYIAPILCKISKVILFPIILGFCFVGAFALNQTFFDVNVMVVFGIIGYLMRKTNYPAAPFLIAMILEPFAEGNLRRFIILSGGNIFTLFSKPLAVIFLALTVFALIHFFRTKGVQK